MPSPSSPWYRRVDPLGPVFALVSVGVFLLHGYGGELSRDLALYSYSGQQVAEGVPPYVSVLNRAGPLAHLVPGLGAVIARALGTDDVLTMRAVMTVLSVLSVWLIYVVGREVFKARLAGAFSAAALLMCQGFVIYATGGPREKTTMMFLVIIGLWATTHRRWATAGVAVALATLTWQPAFVVGASVAVVAMLGLSRRDFWKALLRFALAGIVTTGLFLLGFALVGALDDFAQGFLLINARYTSQTVLAGYLHSDPNDLWRGFGASLYVTLAGLVATLVIAWLRRRHLDRDDPGHMVQIGLGVATITSTIWSNAVAFNGWADLLFVVPVGALGLGGGLHLLLSRRLPARAYQGLMVAVTVAVLVVATVNSRDTRTEVLPQQRKEIAAVMAAAPPDATIASIGAPQPLVLEHRTNPNKYQMFLAGFLDYFENEYPGGINGVAKLIESEHPTLITMDHPEWYYWFHPVLDTEYTRVGTTVDFTWYARNDIGHAAIVDMRRAIAAAK